VSMQIKRLEDRLQVELLHRTKVNVELSSAGEGLLGYARRILFSATRQLDGCSSIGSRVWCGLA
jgi:DNA-binding transcriptional LysR family regulator